MPEIATTGRDGKKYPRAKTSRREPVEPPLSDHRYHSAAMRADAAVKAHKQATNATQRPSLTSSQREAHRAFKAGITGLAKLQSDPDYIRHHGDSLSSELQSLRSRIDGWLLQQEVERERRGAVEAALLADIRDDMDALED